MPSSTSKSIVPLSELIINLIIDNPKLPNELSKNSKLTKYYDQTVHKVITYNGNFNFSKMNNIAVKESTGELLLFLNENSNE